ncbi:MAG: hypothetical protein J0H06_10165, partial [Actinobacteria bacterium]|nr:hypothetical protein [Actinomycetota bacterium]
MEVLMNFKKIALVAAGAALVIAVLLVSSLRSASGGSAMGGMSMAPGEAMQGQKSMTGMQMQGMAPLAPGADGTRASADGLRLELDATTPAAGQPETWTLRVLDEEAKPVTSFERDQTKLMHLIVVRDDFT